MDREKEFKEKVFMAKIKDPDYPTAWNTPVNGIGDFIGLILMKGAASMAIERRVREQQLAEEAEAARFHEATYNMSLQDLHAVAESERGRESLLFGRFRDLKTEEHICIHKRSRLVEKEDHTALEAMDRHLILVREAKRRLKVMLDYLGFQWEKPVSIPEKPVEPKEVEFRLKRLGELEEAKRLAMERAGDDELKEQIAHFYRQQILALFPYTGMEDDE